jgi:hypothetical protein
LQVSFRRTVGVLYGKLLCGIRGMMGEQMGEQAAAVERHSA